MGNWDDVNRLTLIALVQSLVCPKCQSQNRPGATIIDYEPHLRVACCGVCGHPWAVERPAGA